jgi:hypothetical protein
MANNKTIMIKIDTWQLLTDHKKRLNFRTFDDMLKTAFTKYDEDCKNEQKINIAGSNAGSSI